MQRKREYSLIEIWRCHYFARCRASRRCEQVTVIARYLDAQGRPLRQVELCEEHAGKLTNGGVALRDMPVMGATICGKLTGLHSRTF